MGFKINIPPHKRAAGRFIGQVRRDLVRVVEEAGVKYGKTRAAMARNLGCDKSVITRKLSGKSDITLRSIAEIAYEANARPKIVFEKAHIVQEGSNSFSSNTCGSPENHQETETNSSVHSSTWIQAA